MKKLFIILLGLVALICLNIVPFANAQAKPKVANTAAKLMAIRGTVTADERSFVGDQDKKVWTVANPGSVRGHAGHHVAINAQVDTASSKVTVKSVKVLAPETPTNEDDKLRIPRAR
jgi:hypothetical protein